MCARHIVASGIKRVVYIEPYAKSRARELYPDSISVDGDDTKDLSVSFEPFLGVSPNRFIELFQADDRKNEDGSIKEWKTNEARPRLERVISSYISVEAGALLVLDAAVSSNVIRVFDELPKVPNYLSDGSAVRQQELGSNDGKETVVKSPAGFGEEGSPILA